MVHGTPGEDGYLQGYFDLLNIPYSSPGHFECTLTFNKWACNHLLRSLGYNCAKSVLLKKSGALNTDQIQSELGYPVFVKPNDGGSSYGVSKVSKVDDLKKAVEHAFEHGSEVIIESELKGREITNGVLQARGETKVLSITEIVTENEFFDFEAKYKGLSEEITPALLTKEIEHKVKAITKSIYEELGLSGIVRVDYIIEDEEAFVLEINTVPGMSEQSIIPQQLREQGFDITQTLTELILEKIT
jgi:D-alanine-D-alanine ligase